MHSKELHEEDCSDAHGGDCDGPAFNLAWIVSLEHAQPLGQQIQRTDEKTRQKQTYLEFMRLETLKIKLLDKQLQQLVWDVWLL